MSRFFLHIAIGCAIAAGLYQIFLELMPTPARAGAVADLFTSTATIEQAKAELVRAQTAYAEAKARAEAELLKTRTDNQIRVEQNQAIVAMATNPQRDPVELAPWAVYGFLSFFALMSLLWFVTSLRRTDRRGNQDDIRHALQILKQHGMLDSGFVRNYRLNPSCDRPDCHPDPEWRL